MAENNQQSLGSVMAHRFLAGDYGFDVESGRDQGHALNDMLTRPHQMMTVSSYSFSGSPMVEGWFGSKTDVLAKIAADPNALVVYGANRKGRDHLGKYKDAANILTYEKGKGLAGAFGAAIPKDFGFLHHIKVAVADRKDAMVSTANISNSAYRKQYNAYVRSQDAGFVKQVAAVADYLSGQRTDLPSAAETPNLLVSGNRGGKADTYAGDFREALVGATNGKIYYQTAELKKGSVAYKNLKTALGQGREVVLVVNSTGEDGTFNRGQGIAAAEELANGKNGHLLDTRVVNARTGKGTSRTDDDYMFTHANTMVIMDSRGVIVDMASQRGTAASTSGRTTDMGVINKGAKALAQARGLIAQMEGVEKFDLRHGGRSQFVSPFNEAVDNYMPWRMGGATVRYMLEPTVLIGARDYALNNIAALERENTEITRTTAAKLRRQLDKSLTNEGMGAALYKMLRHSQEGEWDRWTPSAIRDFDLGLQARTLGQSDLWMGLTGGTQLGNRGPLDSMLMRWAREVDRTSSFANQVQLQSDFAQEGAMSQTVGTSWDLLQTIIANMAGYYFFTLPMLRLRADGYAAARTFAGEWKARQGFGSRIASGFLSGASFMDRSMNSLAGHVTDQIFRPVAQLFGSKWGKLAEDVADMYLQRGSETNFGTDRSYARHRYKSFEMADEAMKNSLLRPLSSAGFGAVFKEFGYELLFDQTAILRDATRNYMQEVRTTGLRAAHVSTLRALQGGAPDALATHIRNNNLERLLTKSDRDGLAHFANMVKGGIGSLSDDVWSGKVKPSVAIEGLDEYLNYRNALYSDLGTRGQFYHTRASLGESRARFGAAFSRMLGHDTKYLGGARTWHGTATRLAFAGGVAAVAGNAIMADLGAAPRLTVNEQRAFMDTMNAENARGGGLRHNMVMWHRAGFARYNETWSREWKRHLGGVGHLAGQVAGHVAAAAQFYLWEKPASTFHNWRNGRLENELRNEIAGKGAFFQAMALMKAGRLNEMGKIVGMTDKQFSQLDLKQRQRLLYMAEMSEHNQYSEEADMLRARALLEVGPSQRSHKNMDGFSFALQFSPMQAILGTVTAAANTLLDQTTFSLTMQGPVAFQAGYSLTMPVGIKWEKASYGQYNWRFNYVRGSSLEGLSYMGVYGMAAGWALTRPQTWADNRWRRSMSQLAPSLTALQKDWILAGSDAQERITRATAELGGGPLPANLGAQLSTEHWGASRKFAAVPKGIGNFANHIIFAPTNLAWGLAGMATTAAFVDGLALGGSGWGARGALARMTWDDAQGVTQRLSADDIERVIAEPMGSMRQDRAQSILSSRGATPAFADELKIVGREGFRPLSYMLANSPEFARLSDRHAAAVQAFRASRFTHVAKGTGKVAMGTSVAMIALDAGLSVAGGMNGAWEGMIAQGWANAWNTAKALPFGANIPAAWAVNFFERGYRTYKQDNSMSQSFGPQWAGSSGKPQDRTGEGTGWFERLKGRTWDRMWNGYLGAGDNFMGTSMVGLTKQRVDGQDTIAWTKSFIQPEMFGISFSYATGAVRLKRDVSLDSFTDAINLQAASGELSGHSDLLRLGKKPFVLGKMFHEQSAMSTLGVSGKLAVNWRLAQTRWLQVNNSGYDAYVYYFLNRARRGKFSATWDPKHMPAMAWQGGIYKSTNFGWKTSEIGYSLFNQARSYAMEAGQLAEMDYQGPDIYANNHDGFNKPVGTNAYFSHEQKIAGDWGILAGVAFQGASIAVAVGGIAALMSLRKMKGTAGVREMLGHTLEALGSDQMTHQRLTTWGMDVSHDGHMLLGPSGHWSGLNRHNPAHKYWLVAQGKNMYTYGKIDLHAADPMFGGHSRTPSAYEATHMVGKNWRGVNINMRHHADMFESINKLAQTGNMTDDLKGLRSMHNMRLAVDKLVTGYDDLLDSYGRTVRETSRALSFTETGIKANDAAHGAGRWASSERFWFWRRTHRDALTGLTQMGEDLGIEAKNGKYKLAGGPDADLRKAQKLLKDTWDNMVAEPAWVTKRVSLQVAEFEVRAKALNMTTSSGVSRSVASVVADYADHSSMTGRVANVASSDYGAMTKIGFHHSHIKNAYKAGGGAIVFGSSAFNSWLRSMGNMLDPLSAAKAEWERFVKSEALASEAKTLAAALSETPATTHARANLTEAFKEIFGNYGHTPGLNGSTFADQWRDAIDTHLGSQHRARLMNVVNEQQLGDNIHRLGRDMGLATRWVATGIVYPMAKKTLWQGAKGLMLGAGAGSMAREYSETVLGLGMAADHDRDHWERVEGAKSALHGLPRVYEAGGAAGAGLAAHAGLTMRTAYRTAHAAAAGTMVAKRAAGAAAVGRTMRMGLGKFAGVAALGLMAGTAVGMSSGDSGAGLMAGLAVAGLGIAALSLFTGGLGALAVYAVAEVGYHLFFKDKFEGWMREKFQRHSGDIVLYMDANPWAAKVANGLERAWANLDWASDAVFGGMERWGKQRDANWAQRAIGTFGGWMRAATNPMDKTASAYAYYDPEGAERSDLSSSPNEWRLPENAGVNGALAQMTPLWHGDVRNAVNNAIVTQENIRKGNASGLGYSWFDRALYGQDVDPMDSIVTSSMGNGSLSKNFGSLVTFGEAAMLQVQIRGQASQHMMSKLLERDDNWGDPNRSAKYTSNGYDDTVAFLPGTVVGSTRSTVRAQGLGAHRDVVGLETGDAYSNGLIVGGEGQGVAFARAAMSYAGQPYVWGGGHGGRQLAPSGVDCSGLVNQAAQQLGIKSLAATADLQAEMGQSVDFKNLKPGDLVFRNIKKGVSGHVGIYVGNGLVLQAGSGPRTGKVYTSKLTDQGWDFARRVFSDKDGAPRASATTPVQIGKGGTAQWAGLINQAARKHGLPPNLLRAIMQHESGGGHYDRHGRLKTSPTGALGLMQVMPDMPEIGYRNYGFTRDQLVDPAANIMAGAAILKAKIKAQGGDIAEGVRAYNGSGPQARAYRDSVMHTFHSFENQAAKEAVKKPKAPPAKPAKSTKNKSAQTSLAPGGLMASFVNTIHQYLPATTPAPRPIVLAEIQPNQQPDRQPAAKVNPDHSRVANVKVTRRVVVTQAGRHELVAIDHAKGRTSRPAVHAEIDPETKRVLAHATYPDGEKWQSLWDHAYEPVEKSLGMIDHSLMWDA